jgi:hypothetical protein
MAELTRNTASTQASRHRAVLATVYNCACVKFVVFLELITVSVGAAENASVVTKVVERGAVMYGWGTDAGRGTPVLPFDMNTSPAEPGTACPQSAGEAQGRGNVHVCRPEAVISEATALGRSSANGSRHQRRRP